MSAPQNLNGAAIDGSLDLPPPSSGTTKRGLGQIEAALAPSDPEPAMIEEAKPEEAKPEEAKPSNTPTIDAPVANGSPSTKRKMSPTERALIADRTAQVLKTAKPGSDEYADACAERAEIGLAVPKMKHTAVDMHAMQQFQELRGDDVRKSLATGPRYGVWVLVGLGVLAVGMAAYVFTGGPTGAPKAATSAKTTATAVASAPIVTPEPPSTAAATPASAKVVEAASAPAPVVTTASPPIRSAQQTAAPTAPPAVTTAPTAAPSASHNPWAPVWKNP